MASDRVSAFDYQIPNLIPYKGAVLNAITKFAFDNTKDIIQVSPPLFLQRRRQQGAACTRPMSYVGDRYIGGAVMVSLSLSVPCHEGVGGVKGAGGS